MLDVLRALEKARAFVAERPPLVKSEPGPTDESGKTDFWYPPEPALRQLCDAAFKHAGIFDTAEDIRSNGVLKVTWSLYLLDGPGAGQVHRLEMEWPVDVSRSMSRPLASVWSLSHAWRHAMMQLLKVRTVDRAPAPGQAPGGWPQPEQLDKEAAPPMRIGPEAQWEAIGAVIEEPECEAPTYDTRSTVELWSALVDQGGLRWAGLLFAYREYTKNDRAQHVPPDDDAFKSYLASFLRAAPEVRQ